MTRFFISQSTNRPTQPYSLASSSSHHLCFSVIVVPEQLKRLVWRSLTIYFLTNAALCMFALVSRLCSAGWRDVDGRAPRQRGQKEALDQLLGQIKEAHRHCVCHGIVNLFLDRFGRVHLTDFPVI